MKGDFSRWTFNPDNHFSRVLMQQGRVQLDADWNEQVAILLHTMRQMVSDMMGPHGTWDNDAFKVQIVGTEYQINSKGRYYAQGVLVDTATEADNWTKVDGVATSGNTLIYLDVWERHLTYAEADETNQPGLREVALKGADTTTRAKVVWRVGTGAVPLGVNVTGMKTNQNNLTTWLADLEAKKVELINATNSTPITPGFTGLAGLESDLQGQISALVNSLNLFIKSTSTAIPGQLDPLPDESEVNDLFSQLNALLSALKEVLDASDPRISTPATTGYTTAAQDDNKIQQLITRMNLLVEIQKLRVAIETETTTFNSELKKIEEESFDLYRPQLKATTQQNGDTNANTDSCTIPPDAAYTGPENQLYRVEIHKGGDGNAATFKWSRENGTVIFPVDGTSISSSGNEVTVTVENFGRDVEAGLAPGDWVELTYDKLVESLTPGWMLQVKEIGPITGQIILKNAPSSDPNWPDNTAGHPILRRWDQGSDAISVKEGTWLTLENGVQIQFQSPPSKANSTDPNPPAREYRTGDYWLIPARTANRDIEWPQHQEVDGTWVPKAVPPHGIQHYYAPLAIISNGAIIDCRRVFEPLGQPVLPE